MWTLADPMTKPMTLLSEPHSYKEQRQEIVMATPIQIWASFLTLSPFNPGFSRDLQRAQNAWHDEVRIWVDPSVSQTARWAEVEKGIRIREALIQGEQINAFTIYHVDERGQLYPGVGTLESSLTTLPEGFYRLWLNTLPELIHAPETFIWRFPRQIDGSIVFDDATIHSGPGPILPHGNVSKETGEIRMVWPRPHVNLPAPISPENESLQYYRKLNRAKLRDGDEQVDIVVAEGDSNMRAAPFWLKWPAPFHLLFPTGGSVDVLHHHQAMSKCIQQYESGNRDESIQVAETWVQRLVGTSHSSLEQAWFLPKLMVDINAALMDVEGKFNISSSSLEDLLSTEFRKLLLERVPVQRVTGWLGYFWWELYQDLEARIALHFCNRCGSLIRGGRVDRKYCTKEENLTCFRRHNAENQRSSRAKRVP